MPLYSKKHWQRVERLAAKIFNYKFTYLVLGLIILAQFILVSIIFFGKNDDNTALNEKLGKLGSKIEEMDKKLDSIESKQAFTQSQIYRFQQMNNNTDN